MKTVRSRTARRFRFALAVSFALAVVARPSAAAISGVVVDENGAPLAHATVRAFAQETPRERADRALAGKIDRNPLASATTGDDGTFRMDAPRPVVELMASAADRAVFFADAADGDDLGSILLEKSKLLAGRITAEGKPVSGAIVMDGRLLTRAGSDGTFSLPVASGAAARLMVLHPDYAPLETVAPAFERTLELKMTRGVAVRGRVLAADGRTPIAHAIVTIGFSSNAESGADGSFVAARAPVTWRSLRVTAPGGAAFATRSGTAAFNIRLQPASTFSGSVHDAKTHAAIPGMRITLWSQSDANEAITDAKGAFSFSGVSSGVHNVFAVHPAYQIEGGGVVVVSPGDQQVQTYAAIPLAILRGSVIDEGRKVVPAAVVTASPDQGRRAVTNAKGEFSIRVRGTGGAGLTVRKDGYLPTVVAADQVALRATVITLRRGFPLVVTVVDEEKKPVSKASVAFSLSDNPADTPSRPMFRCGEGPCTSGDDGSVEVRLVPGTYSINVGGESVVPKTFAARKLTEKSAPLTLDVQRGVVVSGRVVYSDGSPASEGVSLKAAPAVTLFQQTDASGSFTFSNAPRGPVTLKVQAGFGGSPGSGPVGGVVGGVGGGVVFGGDAARTAAAGKDVNAPATDVVLTMPPDGRISGTVVDSTTRQPIAEFQILPLRGQGPNRPATFNSNDGTFTIEHVPAGKIDVQATAAGYVRGTVSDVEVADGKTTTNVEVRLDPAARVTGRVSGRDGAPIAGVYVMVVESGPRQGAIADSAATDSNGEFKLTSVPPGDRRLAFSKQGFLRQEKAVESAASKESHVDVVLDRGLELRGRVVDESGQPVPSASISAQAPGDGSVGRSDADGSFVVSGLRDLHYALVARKNGFAEGRIDDVVPGGTAGPLTITLRRGATVTGHVSNVPAGTTWVGVNIIGDRTSTNGRVDSSGSFSVTGVPDGNFTAEASAAVPGSSSRRSGRVQVSVVNATAAPVELTFTDGFTVQGRVTVGGKPAGGANVMFMSMSPAVAGASAPVAADGTYSVAGLAAGDYRISANFGGNIVYSEKYTVTSSSVYDIDVHTGSLRGRITDSDTGVPLANAMVGLMNLDRNPVYVRPRSSDLDGAYSFDQMVEGNWRLTVQKDGYRTETRSVTVAGAATADVQLSAGTKTTLQLVDASDGRPVIGFVTVTDSSKKPAGMAQAHSDGSVDLWLSPGTYTAFANAQQYFSDPATFTAPGADVRIPMRRSGRVVVRWTRAGVASVQLSSATPRMTMRTPSGSFESVRPGQWVAQLLGADNKPIAEQPVSVAEGQTATVVFP